MEAEGFAKFKDRHLVIKAEASRWALLSGAGGLAGTGEGLERMERLMKAAI